MLVCEVNHNKEFAQHLDNWFKGRDVILKLQLPLAGSAGQRPPALAYDEDRKVDMFVRISEKLIDFVKGQPKAFVKARVGKDHIEVHALAPWQSW